MWVFLGSSGISSSSWCFSEVVGEINHVATETEIEVGWVKVKKSYLILQVGKWKSVLIDNVLLKEIPRACYLRPFCFPEVRSAGEFENFSMFRWLFLLLLLLLFFVYFFFVFSFFFFVFFVFVPRGKSSVSSLGCFRCFFHFKISYWDVVAEPISMSTPQMS